jgi:uncharacterized protein YecA (UPF0149 family)
MGGEYSDKEMERIEGQVHEWLAEFSRSKHFDQLNEDQKQESEFIMETFSEFMYSHHGLSPHEWSASELEECCLETLPRKISADDAYFKSTAPVLSAFFAFAQEKKLLKNALILAQKVQAISKQIEKNASNPKTWGMAKSLVMAAKESGVDVTNQDELHQFITRYNERILSQPKAVPKSEPKAEPVHVAQKIGRNEHCPCGSGKKYNRCCGR